MNQTKPTISYEFFPPKSANGLDALVEEAKSLAATKPAFMTVTYGAGGSTRDGTIETVRRIREATGINTAAHLTYINTRIDEVYEYVDKLWDEGIRHIIALRGDLPSDLAWPLDPDENYFQHTSTFVEGLKSRHNFEISVAAYPEKHPDAPSIDADIASLKMKCDAGADRAITQFFFDNNVFYEFLERTAKAGITTPIVPGILPVSNYEKMLKFANMCQTHVPDWVKKKFEPFLDNQDGIEKAGEEILCEQVQDLAANGIPHLHFYTLNKAPMSLAACRSCGADNHDNTGEAAAGAA